MASPASPRLPSPPPIPEDQLSPVPASAEQQKLFNNLEHAAARRIRPGSKAEDMAEGPPLVDLSENESSFQLTEHLKALHNFFIHSIGSNSMVPVDREMAFKLAQSPENVDKTLWLYELCRFLTQKVNSIIVALFSDNPACSSVTCPEMRASEWQYLCAVHDPPKSCCAIDYCCHTLDWAANTLTSPKHFPSRLALGADQSTQHSQMRQLTNIFRRVYRIFAHAWFQHRDMFWKVEGRTGLYVFFKTVCDVYGLIPEDNYTIPAEAEGIEPVTDTTSSIPPLILKRESVEPSPYDSDTSTLVESMADHSLSTAGTTKRHRHSPSVGATTVQTVVEENEEEDERPSLQSRPVTQIFEAAAEEEEGEDGTDITVIEESETADDETEAAEETSEAVQAATPAMGVASEENAHEVAAADGAEPKSEDTQKQSNGPSPEPVLTDKSDDDVPAAKDTDGDAHDSETEATQDGVKPIATPSEITKGTGSAAVPVNKTDEDAKTGTES